MGHAATHPVLLDRVHGEEIWHGVLQKMLEQIGKSAKRQKLFSDELLLEAMITESGLIEAWEILSPPNTRANLNSEEIAKTADLLESIASRDDVPAGDDGPIYLAAVASLLRMREMDHALVLANSPGGDGDVSKIKKKYGLMIQAILKPHLLPMQSMVAMRTQSSYPSGPSATFTFACTRPGDISPK